MTCGDGLTRDSRQDRDRRTSGSMPCGGRRRGLMQDSGEVVAENSADRLAVVVLSGRTYSVLQWLDPPGLRIGERLDGEMDRGGWIRLINRSTGLSVRACRHLYGCSQSDAYAFSRIERPLD